MKTPNSLLHGALDALILKTLTRGPSHGYAIARHIEEMTGDAVLVEEGSLYPALYRLDRRGWVEAEWGTSELGRRAKLYRLTDAGRKQLADETAMWRRFSDGVSKMLLPRG
jgi:PadR family transcriptional regulator, regulatory protein PadR